MSETEVFLTVVYIAYIASPLLPDELWLRSALTVTSIGFIVWGTFIGDEVVIIANGLFAVLSLRQVARLLKERRPIELTAEQGIVHDRLFPSMTARQFLLFWHLGEPFEECDVMLITKGEPVGYVSALIDGNAVVELEAGDLPITTPSLIGEMSFVRGDQAPASANVSCTGAISGRRWRKADLYSLRDSHPSLTEPFLRSLGADLAAKVAG